MSIEEYNRISSTNIAQYIINPKQYQPVPNRSDFDRGWIYRYFVRKINDENGNIIELSSAQYDVYNNFNLFLIARIRWNITLPHTLDTGDGAIEFNRKQIRKGMHLIPNLNIYFSNLLEFHREGGRASVGFLLPEGQMIRADGIIIVEMENKIIGRITK